MSETRRCWQCHSEFRDDKPGRLLGELDDYAFCGWSCLGTYLDGCRPFQVIHVASSLLEDRLDWYSAYWEARADWDGALRLLLEIDLATSKAFAAVRRKLVDRERAKQERANRLREAS